MLDQTASRYHLKAQIKYTLLFTVLYFSISLAGILHHELWLDEAHHWLLARDSNSFADLVLNTRYEGHPLLWNILLFGLTRLTWNPFWMQLLHIFIATAAVFVFLRKAPLPKLFQVLFIFGYFMVFEYSLVSRNYSLGVLFLFLACAVFGKRETKFTTLAIWLALAANVHLMFGIVAFAITIGILSEHFRNKEMLYKANFTGYGILAFGFILMALQVIPPGDTKFFIPQDAIPILEKCTKGFLFLFKGLLTIPDFTSIHFWNSNILVAISKPLSAVAALLCYLLPLCLFRNRKTLFFVYCALAGAQVFFYFTQRGATRFDGLGLLIIIIALWLEEHYNRKPEPRDIFKHGKWAAYKNPIVLTLLLIQFASGISAYAIDFSRPFTASRQAADYLSGTDLEGLPVVCISCEGTALSPYLEKKIWFLCLGNYQSYCLWDSGCESAFTPENIIPGLSGYMQTHSRAVFLSNSPLEMVPENGHWAHPDGKIKIRFRKKFTQTIIRNSGYYIYEVSKSIPKKLTFKS